MPNLDNLTIFEGIWVLITGLGFIVLLQLYRWASGDLKLVISTKTNGARLMVARSIRRRNLLRILQSAGLLIPALIAAFVAMVDEDWRWVIPVFLTGVTVFLTLNAILDARDRTRLIDYVERLEAKARAGEQP